MAKKKLEKEPEETLSKGVYFLQTLLRSHSRDLPNSMKKSTTPKQCDIASHPPKTNEDAAGWWKRIKGKPSWEKLTNDERTIRKLFVLLSKRKSTT